MINDELREGLTPGSIRLEQIGSGHEDLAQLQIRLRYSADRLGSVTHQPLIMLLCERDGYAMRSMTSGSGREVAWR